MWTVHTQVVHQSIHSKWQLVVDTQYSQKLSHWNKWTPQQQHIIYHVWTLNFTLEMWSWFKVMTFLWNVQVSKLETRSNCCLQSLKWKVTLTTSNIERVARAWSWKWPLPRIHVLILISNTGHYVVANVPLIVPWHRWTESNYILTPSHLLWHVM